MGGIQKGRIIEKSVQGGAERMKKWFVFGALLIIALALSIWWQNTNDPNVLYNKVLSEEFKAEVNDALIEQCATEVNAKVNWEYEDHCKLSL